MTPEQKARLDRAIAHINATTARPAVGLTGLLSSAVYSEPGQAALRTVVSNRPEGVGLIGDICATKSVLAQRSEAC